MDDMSKRMGEKYRKYYDDLFSKYGEDPKSLDLSRDSQLHRFEVLAQIGDLKGRSILDVGCGFGDFYGYLVGNLYEFGEYVGVELSEGMVVVGRTRYPKATIIHGDFLNPILGMTADYVIASGIFSLEDPDWGKHFTTVVKKMFALSKVGIGFNLLSTNSLNFGKMDQFHFESPWAILRFALKELSEKVILRHDYRKNDFTIFAYK